jgi:hypothetical protein
MTLSVGAFLKGKSVIDFSAPRVAPESTSQPGNTCTGRGQDYSMYPKTMRQSVGFAGEIGRVQRPSRRAGSEFNVRGREVSDFQVSSPEMEQQSLQQPPSIMEEASIQQRINGIEESKMDLPFINGQGRAFLNHYSEKECLAMPITDEMVTTFKHITESKELVANGTKVIKDAEREIRSLERDIRRAEEDLDFCQTREERHHTCVELAKLREDLGQAERRVEELKNRLEADGSNLRYARDTLEGYFGEVLEAGGLLEDVKASTGSVNEQDEAPTADMEAFGYTWPPPYAEQPPPSSAELAMQAAQENLDRSLGDLLDVQFRFNERRQHYMQALAEYQLLLEMGELDYTMTEFELRDIERVQRLTQELITAEESYKAAKTYAKDLGLPHFDPYQTSDFVDRDDDGYRESEEAEEVTGVDRSRIQRWQYGVAHARMTNRGLRNDAELTEIDEWDARTVDIDDSASAVDVDRYCSKIELWAK